MRRVEQVTGISVQDLSASFLRSLRAENKSSRTVETYGDAVRAFARFLKDRGKPTSVDAVTREHGEAWIQDLLARWKPATAANRYRALQRFLGYAVDEGEIRANPMANMKPPKIPENPPDVLGEDQLRDLSAASIRGRWACMNAAPTASCTSPH